MDLRQILFRVYIRISGGYDVAAEALKPLDMMTLLEEVAKSNPDGDTRTIYDAENDKFFEKRTKWFVVHKAEKFIAGILDAPSENEDMAKYASIKQLNLLIRAFNEDKKCISGFGLVYIYVIYSLLEGKSPMAADCATYVNALSALVEGYLEDHDDDEVAAFLVGCKEPILNAIQNKNTQLAGPQLPRRPCRNPKENAE